MEKAGTGIKRVKDACASNNNKVKFDFTDAFWVTIMSNEVNVFNEDVGKDLNDIQKEYIEFDKKQ